VHPESFVRGACAVAWGNDAFGVLTQVVRLKRYGRKRLGLVHEPQDLGDTPRFLLTDALHWDSGRVLETWRYRWAAEIFSCVRHAGVRLEAAQGAQGGSGQAPLSLELRSAVVAPADTGFRSATERFAFAQGDITIEQLLAARP